MAQGSEFADGLNDGGEKGEERFVGVGVDDGRGSKLDNDGQARAGAYMARVASGHREKRKKRRGWRRKRLGAHLVSSVRIRESRRPEAKQILNDRRVQRTKAGVLDGHKSMHTTDKLRSEKIRNGSSERKREQENELENASADDPQSLLPVPTRPSLLVLLDLLLYKESNREPEVSQRKACEGGRKRLTGEGRERLLEDLELLLLSEILSRGGYGNDALGLEPGAVEEGVSNEAEGRERTRRVGGRTNLGSSGRP